MRNQFISLPFILALIFGVTLHGQTFFTNGVGTGLYDTPGNWSGGAVPVGGAQPWMGTTNVNGLLVANINYNNGANLTTTSRFVLGIGAAGGNGSLTLGATAGTLTYGGDTFGNANYVGVDGGIGALALNGGGITLNAGTYLRIGANAANARGTVTVNGGLLNVASNIIVANGNTSNVGTLTVNGGEVRANQLWIVSNDAGGGNGGTGNLNVGGTGVLRTQGANPRIFVGGRGATAAPGAGLATLTLSGSGQIISDNDFIVGFTSPAVGTQTGGSITVNAPGTYFVGAFSTGTVTQSGGTVTIDPASPEGLSIGTRSGAPGAGNGTYHLNGGTLITDQIIVSQGGGTGVFDMGGGTWQFNGAVTNAIPIALTGGTSGINTNGNNGTLSGLLTGPGGLQKSGAGTLTLSNPANTFSGDMTIAAGTVIAAPGHPNANPTSVLGSTAAGRTVSVSSGAALQFTANDVFGNAGATPGLTLAINGGTVTSTNVFNTLGPVTLNGGTLASTGGANANFHSFRFLGPVTVTGTAPSNITTTGTNSDMHLNASTTFDVADVTGTSAADLIVNGILRNRPDTLGAGSLVKDGAGTMQLLGNQTYTGSTTISAGTLQLGDGTTSGTLNAASAIAIGAAGTLELTPGAAGTTTTNFISGLGGLLKTGGNTATLSNTANTFSGDVTVAAGTLVAGAGHNNTNPTSVLGSTAARTISVSSGATLQLNANDVFGNANAAPALTLAINGGTVTTSFFNTIGPVTLNGGTLASTGGALPTNQSYRLLGPVTVTGTAPSNITTTGTNSDIHLDATTTFAVADVTGSAAADLIISGRLRNQSNSQALAPAGLLKTGNGTLSLSNTGNSFSGDMTIAAGTVIAAAGHNDLNPTSVLGSTSAARTVSIESGATLRLNANDVFGNASASPNLTLAINGGTVTTGNNFNTLGPIILNGGTLAATGGVNGAYRSYRLFGSVTVTGTAPSTISTTGANSDIHLHSSTAFDVADVTGDTNADLIVNGRLGNQSGNQGQAAGSLVKIGTGTMQLVGDQPYTGSTTISAGTLQLGDGAAAGTINGSSTIAIGNSGTLQLTPGAAGTTVTQPISGTGIVRKSGANSTATVNNAASFTGSYQVDGGTLALASTNMGQPTSIHIAGGAIFDTLNTMFAPTAAVNISGTGTVATGGAGLNWNNFVTIAPGNSPDVLNIGGPVNWNTATGGTYLWEVADASGPGNGISGSDLINITGTLDMTGGSGTINAIALVPDLAIAVPPVPMEPGAQTLFEIIRTSAGVIGFGSFSPTFVNNMNHKGMFKLILSGNSVYLLWEATPEPGTWVLMACLIGAVGLIARRRQITK